MDGATLRRLRLRLKLTQVQLADRLGVSPNTIARWERDEVGISPAMEKLIRLLASMGRGPR